LIIEKLAKTENSDGPALIVFVNSTTLIAFGISFPQLAARIFIFTNFSINFSKYPPAEPEALRLLAPQRGLFATG
jgi:hypothetical protein